MLKIREIELVMAKAKSGSQSIKEEGYEIHKEAFSDEEFSAIKRAITEQYKERIKELITCKEIQDHMNNEFPPALYHEIAHLIDHEKAWPKPERVLNEDFLRLFKETKYFKSLVSRYGRIEVTDEEYLGHGNIYWRIVRPEKERDIGKLHRDSWFWDIDKEQPLPNYKYKRIKVWIAINCEEGLNGFKLIEKSHLDEQVKWRVIEKDGRKKPVLDDIRYERADLINTRNNTAILFDDKLIHGGALNRGKMTRVSIEFTGFVKDE